MTGKDMRSHYTCRWNGGYAARKAHGFLITILGRFAVHSVVYLSRTTPTQKAITSRRVRSANWMRGRSTGKITSAST
jgi:hypothetical protein